MTTIINDIINLFGSIGTLLGLSLLGYLIYNYHKMKKENSQLKIEKETYKHEEEKNEIRKKISNTPLDTLIDEHNREISSRRSNK